MPRSARSATPATAAAPGARTTTPSTCRPPRQPPSFSRNAGAKAKPEGKKNKAVTTIAASKRSELIRRCHAEGLTVGRGWVTAGALEARLAAPGLHRVWCVAANGARVALQRSEHLSVQRLALIRDNYKAIGPPNKRTIKKWRHILGTGPELDSHLYSAMCNLIQNDRGTEPRKHQAKRKVAHAGGGGAHSCDGFSKREAKRLCREHGLKSEGTLKQLKARLRYPSQHSVQVKTPHGLFYLHKTRHLTIKHLRIIRDNYPKLGHITRKNLKQFRRLLGGRDLKCTDAHLFGVTGVLKPAAARSAVPATFVLPKKMTPPPMTRALFSSQAGPLAFNKMPAPAVVTTMAEAKAAAAPPPLIVPLPLPPQPPQPLQPLIIGGRHSPFALKWANYMISSQVGPSAFNKMPAPAVVTTMTDANAAAVPPPPPPPQPQQPLVIGGRHSPFALKWADYMVMMG
jgi:hypothetical protein